MFNGTRAFAGGRQGNADGADAVRVRSRDRGWVLHGGQRDWLRRVTRSPEAPHLVPRSPRHYLPIIADSSTSKTSFAELPRKVSGSVFPTK